MKWKTEYTVLSIIAGLVITIIIMAVVWSKHVCIKTDVAPLEKQIIESQLKIKEYENKITKDSLIIWNSTRDELDSMRSIRREKYMRSNPL